METNIITKIDFFDFMRAFFTDKVKYAKLTQNAKKPHTFMFRRMMSIMYPIQMNAIASVDDVRLMDALHKVFCTGTYPKWMYTSGSTDKQTKAKLVHTQYSREVVDSFMECRNVEYKSLLMLEEWDPQGLKKELDTIQDELNPEMKKYSKKKKPA